MNSINKNIPSNSFPQRRRRKCNKYTLAIIWTSCLVAYIVCSVRKINHNPNDIENLNIFNDLITSDFETNSTSTTYTRTYSGEMPDWIKNYIKWHNSMREKFPGKQIIEHPDAPKVLVRICLGLCGGLHDRIGQLPLDLYLANQTQRVLLIKWQKPQPLEEFLVPPSFHTTSDSPEIPVHDPTYHGLYVDWTFPTFVKGWGTLGDNCITLNECARQVRSQPKIDGNVQNHKEFDNVNQYAELIDNNLKAMKEGDLKDTKHLTFTILGHLGEEVLEKRLQDLGEEDLIHQTPTFGKIFHTFFKPHPKIQQQIDDVERELGLVKNEYTAVHCRVRHPKGYAKSDKFDGKWISNADKTGLPLTGMFHDIAVRTATHAIQCAAEELPFNVDKHPIYFMADESNLVNYLVHNLTDSNYAANNPQWFEKGVNLTALQIVNKFHVVARDQSVVNAHIDKNKGRASYAYYATFVDLFLGINAKCVSFGLGYYATFAAKISGTSCKVRYAEERWGKSSSVHRDTAPMCKLRE